jgi:hypothetical protein
MCIILYIFCVLAYITDHLVVDGGACVRTCGPGRMPNELTQVCEDCIGPCPKKCKGTDKMANDFITDQNIANFTDCTIIEGSIKILGSTFKGYVVLY